MTILQRLAAIEAEIAAVREEIAAMLARIGTWSGSTRADGEPEAPGSEGGESRE